MTREPEDLPVLHTRCCDLRGLRPDKDSPCANRTRRIKNVIPEALCFGDFFLRRGPHVPADSSIHRRPSLPAGRQWPPLSERLFPSYPLPVHTCDWSTQPRLHRKPNRCPIVSKYGTPPIDMKISTAYSWSLRTLPMPRPMIGWQPMRVPPVFCSCVATNPWREISC